MKDCLPELGAQIPESLLEDKELEVHQYLAHRQYCGKCPGYKRCSYFCRKPILRYIPEETRLNYVVGDHCGAGRTEKEKEKAERLFKDCQLPKGFGHMIFRTFENHVLVSKAFYAARDLAQGKAMKGLYLFGKSGRGKTHLAVSILQDRLKKGQGGIYTTSAEFLRLLKQFDKGDTDELLELVRSTPFLLLDDLGAEQGTHFEIVKLFEIINHRTNEMRSRDNPFGLTTVITSNYSPQELIQRWQIPADPEGPTRIVSRIAEMCLRMEMSGPDHRLEKKLRRKNAKSEVESDE